MIRRADQTDIPKFVDIARIMHGEGVYEKIPFQAEMYQSFLEIIFASDVYAAWVYEVDGEVTGAIIGSLGPFMFNPILQAADVGLYVKPDRRRALAAPRLVWAYEEWAASKGAVRSHLNSSNGYEKAGAFFERMGYTQSGVNYYKDLTAGDINVPSES